jgi:hypothetical protein
VRGHDLYTAIPNRAIWSQHQSGTRRWRAMCIVTINRDQIVDYRAWNRWERHTSHIGPMHVRSSSNMSPRSAVNWKSELTGDESRTQPRAWRAKIERNSTLIDTSCEYATASCCRFTKLHRIYIWNHTSVDFHALINYFTLGNAMCLLHNSRG